jgi:drug/metabolite transporter (DMT)-like permease
MATMALVLTLLAAVMHATWNFILKDSEDRLATVVGIALVGGLLYAPWIYWAEGLPTQVVEHLATSSLVHVAYFASLVIAYDRSDFSVAYPVARGIAPALVAVGGWVFLADSIGRVEAVGVAVIVAAILWIAWTPGSRTALRGSGVGWAAFTGLTIAVYTVIDAAAVRQAGKALAYSVSLALLSGAGLALLALRTRSAAEVLAPVRERPGAVGIAAALNIGAYALVLFAATRAPVALVSAVRETSVIFGAIAGLVFLGEPFGRRRLLGAAGVAVGVIVLGLP